MSVDIQLKNVVLSDESIEGDLDIRVSMLHVNVSRTEHFRVPKNSERNIELGRGMYLRVKITHEPPASVCVTGRVVDRLGSVDVPKHCVPI